MKSFRKSSVQLAKLNKLSLFQAPRSGARYSTEGKIKPMAVLARPTPQTVKLVYTKPKRLLLTRNVYIP